MGDRRARRLTRAENAAAQRALDLAPRGVWLVARTLVRDPYPCRCKPDRTCDPFWCPCAGRRDVSSRLPGYCCARRAALALLALGAAA